jgi:hypothetical protein
MHIRSGPSSYHDDVFIFTSGIVVGSSTEYTGSSEGLETEDISASIVAGFGISSTKIESGMKEYICGVFALIERYVKPSSKSAYVCLLRFEEGGE